MELTPYEREHRIKELVKRDINDIVIALANQDYEFLEAVLTGNGFVGYNNLSDQDLLSEFPDLNQAL